MRINVDTESEGTGTVLTPLVAVLEVSGAILSWTVDDPSAAPLLTFTDPDRADWLWRVVGEAGHVAIAAAAESGETVDVADVELISESVEPLRRLALGHWLRRWWPASHRDGIAELDRAILDAEIAVLTDAAEVFFTDDTLDSDVAELLRPHADALGSLLREGDPRVEELVRAAIEIAEDAGVEVTSPALATASTGRRDDYALAAGSVAGQPGSTAVARGVGSIDWAAVPPGVFDAAEDTVDWNITTSDDQVVTAVQAELSGPGAAGIPVRVQSGEFTGSGVFDAAGWAELPIVDGEQRPMSESSAWDHDWRGLTVHVGALPAPGETAAVRERVRDVARQRLRQPADDAFLAEILASEADY
jgi:hypothetical protein